MNTLIETLGKHIKQMDALNTLTLAAMNTLLPQSQAAAGCFTSGIQCGTSPCVYRDECGGINDQGKVTQCEECFVCSDGSEYCEFRSESVACC